MIQGFEKVDQVRKQAKVRKRGRPIMSIRKNHLQIYIYYNNNNNKDDDDDDEKIIIIIIVIVILIIITIIYDNN